MNQTTDIALAEMVARCRRGDMAAYKAVYQLYARPMLNSSMRIVNNLADAEDMVQEAFADAFQNIAGFTFKCPLEAWLRRIVINKSISLLRKRKINWVQEDVNTLQPADTGTDEALWQYRVGQVKQAIALLPDAQRIIFNLHAVDEMPHEEIAALLQLSHSNVRIIYHRAKKKIIALIKNMPDE